MPTPKAKLSRSKVPSVAQQFVAYVRAAVEAEKLRLRKPYLGGFLTPMVDIRDTVAEKFGIPQHTLFSYLTYSRACTHPWSSGACSKCPSVEHLCIPPHVLDDANG